MHETKVHAFLKTRHGASPEPVPVSFRTGEYSGWNRLRTCLERIVSEEHADGDTAALLNVQRPLGFFFHGSRLIVRWRPTTLNLWRSMRVRVWIVVSRTKLLVVNVARVGQCWQRQTTASCGSQDCATQTDSQRRDRESQHRVGLVIGRRPTKLH